MPHAVAIDTETYLIRPGEFAPKTVCVSLHNEKRSALVLADEGAAKVENLLRRGYTTVWANPGFDIATLCGTRPELFSLFVDALEAGRVWCVQLAQKLIDIADGCRQHQRYNLAVLTKRFFDQEMDKDTWRLRYAELDGTPVTEWPEGAREYAEKDAEYTWKLYELQRGQVSIDQLAERVRFDVSLYWQSREGMAVSEDEVLRLQKKTLAKIAKLQPRLVRNGLLKNTNKDAGKIDLFTGEVSEPSWGKDVKRIQGLVEATGHVLLTEKGGTSINNEALLECADPLLDSFAEYAKLQSLRNKDLKFLLKGVEDGRIHTRYDSLLDTGRTSSRGPNLQNLKREPGVRECFVPSAGYVFLDADYSAAELHTLAQSCLNLLGKSKLAEALNAGLDPHIMMGGRMVGITDYETAKAHPNMKSFRQAAKALNYGLPGGMGPGGLAKYAKSMGIDLVANGFPAVRAIREWRKQWPEMVDLFEWVRGSLPYITLPVGQHRVRKTDFFTAGCNFLFQGSAADAAGLASWALFKECYVHTESPLFGCRPVLFVHDQFVIESPEDRARPALDRMVEVMRDEFNRITPDVPVGVEGEVKTWWSK